MEDGHEFFAKCDLIALCRAPNLAGNLIMEIMVIDEAVSICSS